MAGTAYKLRWYVTTDGSGNVEPFWFPFGDDLDTVLYEPNSGDATKITILAGGQFTAHDGTVYRIEADISLDIDTDWSADGSLAVGFAYLWAGEDSGGDLTIVFYEDADELPSELVKGRRLRGGVSIWDDSGTKKVISFAFDGDWCWYDVDISCGGSDRTEVFDGDLSSFNSVDCSDFVPAGKRMTVIKAKSTTGDTFYDLYFRLTGSSITGGLLPTGIMRGEEIQQLPVNDSGQMDLKAESSTTARISVVGYQANRRQI